MDWGVGVEERKGTWAAREVGREKAWVHAMNTVQLCVRGAPFQGTEWLTSEKPSHAPSI